MPSSILSASVNLTSTTPVVITSVTLAANSYYEIEAQVRWSEVNATDGGIAAGLSVTGASQLVWTDGQGASLGSGGAVNYTGSVGSRTIIISGTIATSSADVLNLNAAQSVASLNATTVLTLTLLNVELIGAVPAPAPALPSSIVTTNVNLTTTVPLAVASVSLAANSSYEIEARVLWSEVNPTDGGISTGLSVTGASQLVWTDGQGATLGTGGVVVYTGSTGSRTIVITGTVVTGAAADTLILYAAQAVASANPTTLLALTVLNVEILGTVAVVSAGAGLTAQQICDLARQIANVPGFTTQSGQLLNAILSDLAQTYDFEANLRTYPFTFDVSTVYQNNAAGAGPTLFPVDYLRAKNNEIIYYINGVRYVLVIEKQASYDALVQTAGWNSYPTYGFVDLSLSTPFSVTNPGQVGLMVWPPASGAFTAQLRYYCQPANITNPETSSTVPWFPNTNYLITRVAGELMKLTDDERTSAFLGSETEAQDSAQSATSILRKFLKMKDDPEGSVRTVQLDRRRFGPQFANLKNTKNIGW